MDFEAALTKLWPNGDQKIPGLRAGIIASAPRVFTLHKINSPLVLAHIMAQISHECGAGHDVVESLNYTAKRMTEVWPTRFPTIESALLYAGKPRELANKVYNGRMGNQPESDDGWNFRGRGGSQTTGREGYERVKKQTGLDVVANPDMVNDPRYFLLCAVSDFVNCGCLPFAEADDVAMVTKRLNGGFIGLAERKAWLARWKAANVPVPTRIVPASAPPAETMPVAPSITTPAKGSIGDFIAGLLAAIFRRK